MTAAQHKDYRTPDEVRTFGHGRLELLRFGDSVVGKMTLEPGWRWSTDVKPVAKTDWCLAPHFQYQVSGQLHVKMADGAEFDTTAGTVSLLPAGHDAWVVGNEPVVLIDWDGARNYARS